MIEPTDLPGATEDMAWRIIGYARSIASCLDDLPAGRERSIAVSVLKGVAAEGTARGSRLVKSQRVGTASVDYAAVGSWFSDDDRAALRSLCSAGVPAGIPVGRFPKAGMLGRVWPEVVDES